MVQQEPNVFRSDSNQNSVKFTALPGIGRIRQSLSLKVNSKVQKESKYKKHIG